MPQSGPNESPLNVRKLKDVKNIFETLHSKLEFLLDLEETGIILSAVTYFGTQTPDNSLGKNGDFFLKEDTINQQWFVFAKKDNVWELIGDNP